MTASTRTELKALFETGDNLLQTSFEDLIDSFLSLEDTGAQTVTSDVTFNNNLTVGGSLQLTSTTAYGITGTLGFTGIFRGNVGSVAALGTSQGSAAPLTEFISVIRTVSPGSNDGVILSNLADGGEVKHIINAVTATAILYPQSGTIPAASIDGRSSVKIKPLQRVTVVNTNVVSAFSMVMEQASG